MPEREKQVIYLYYYDELTMREIGKVLDITESMNGLTNSYQSHTEVTSESKEGNDRQLDFIRIKSAVPKNSTAYRRES